MAPLGAHRATYDPKPQRWAGSAFAAVALTLMIALAVVSGNVALNVCMALLFAGFAAITIDKALSARRGRNAKLELFEHGLLFTDGDGPRSSTSAPSTTPGSRSCRTGSAPCMVANT
ncbi:hypothetical protein ABT369_09135 [Dactylosporangium sp. NPDC000244]|uniref:hypothetical protein n=1 Tax=Dactylosporangium sp. NPDC000244 TaxID=3154365 RepID=UPI0033286308